MSRKHRLYRMWSSVILIALLVGAFPAPALSQAPDIVPPPPASAPSPGAIPLPEDALILPESLTSAPEAPEVSPPAEALALDLAPSSVLSPDSCAAPGKVPFGQDFELLAGPLNSFDTYALDQSLTWSPSKQLRYSTDTQNSDACPSSRMPGPEQVLIFEHSSYGGACRVMNVGAYPKKGMLGIGNDKLTSLRVGSNVEAYLCRNEDYGGTCETFQTSDSNVGNNAIGNDTVSSMQVIRTPRAYAITAVPLGPDAAEVIYKTDGNTGELVSQRWRAFLGWQHTITTTRLGLVTPGSPVAVSRTPTDYTIAARTSTGGIKVMHGNRDAGPSMAWEDIPGGYDADLGAYTPLTDVAGDPALIAPTPYSLKLFYRSSIDNSIKFTEWSSGYGWRSEPVSLGGVVASDPVAVARDAGHIAVFVVGTNYSLYVKEWSSANQSDWSDVTTWARLTANAAPYVKKEQKLAVASLHSNHIGVAFLQNANTVYYIQWTPAGWSTATEIGGYVEPVGLIAAGVDDMALYGANASGYFYTNHWTESGGWQGWLLQERSYGATRPLAPLSFRPGQMVFFGRNSGNYLQVKSYGLGGTLAMNTTANTSRGELRGQAIATVDAKTFWVSVYRHTDGFWYLSARSTASWTGVTIKLTDHPTAATATNNVSVTTADLDRDGNDEIIIATLNTTGSTGRLSVRRLTLNSAGTVTGITTAAAADFSYSGETLTDINVATGNVNNPTTTASGLADEIVVAAFRSGYTQVFLKTFRFTGSSLTGLTGQLVDVTYTSDLELTIAKVDANLVDKIFIGCSSGASIAALYQYRFGTSSYTLENTATASDPIWYASPSGPYSTALASGDIDSDGFEEVVYATGSYLYVYPIDGKLAAGPYNNVGSGATRSLVIGDLDREGLAEVVYGASNGIQVFRHLGGGASHPHLQKVTGRSQAGVPLLADLDGDSLVASYLDCAPFEDRQVISVINAAPRWYWTNPATQVFEPCSQSEGGIANTDSSATGDEKGWYTSIGASVTVGFKQEISVIVKIGEFSNETTASFTAQVGQSTSTEDSETTMTGADFQKPYTGETTGRVCYLRTGYTCYAYNVSQPGATGNSQIMMHCVPQPTQVSPHICDSMEMWYSTSSRNAAGTSWAPVGHRLSDPVMASVSLNEPGNYHLPPATGRAYPPVDNYLVWWDGYSSRITVRGDPNPTSGGYNWSFQREHAVGETFQHSYEGSLSNTSRAEVFGAVVAGSITVGAGGEFANSVTWSNGLEFSGKVYNFEEACATAGICQEYTVVPYVYQATAKTSGGDTYGYLEQDYYLATLGALNQAQSAEPDATTQGVEGLAVAPQDPIITSPTHPNAGTWYAGNTVTLNWEQPVGDPAALEGYKWAFNQIADYAPTRSSVLTTTATYEAMSDGLYYFHLQAIGPGIDRSAVVHRAIRVDNNGPQVTFVTNPVEPDGYNGWFVSPVAVSLTATDTVGSGISGIEVSTDGATWQPYAAALPVTADTAGDTFWARATDLVGNVSDPVSTTIKLDRTAPTTKEPDTPYHLSYSNIITTEVGNAQLVMGGVLRDALSGRYQVEVKAGDLSLWHTVDAIGEFPMPQDNGITTTTQSTLNWIYTPTFSVRGVYPLWARGVDAAGNYEDDKLIAALWWEPDDIPVLNESQVTASHRVAHPGDTIAFTIGARNSGYQEAQLLITNTVPAGLTVLPNTISDGGQYDEATRTIVWNLYALWPGETHYLYFSAEAGSVTESVILENQVTMLGYWPWWDLSAYDPNFPDAPASHPYTTTATLTVLPGSGQAGGPKVTGIGVVEGPVVTAPNVTILVNASPETRHLYVKEWIWDTALSRWQLAAESGWVPFASAPGFEMTQDAQGLYGRYAWTLSEGDGIKYLGVWIADDDGRISNLNDGNLLYTNLLSTAGQSLAADERVQYRLPAKAQDLVLLSLLTLSGDADLYVWQPRAGFMPHFYSNGAGGGAGLPSDTVAFYAPEEGMYIVEVHAVTDSVYRLISASTLSTASMTGADDPSLADTALPQSTHLALADKDRPAHPLTLSTPLSGSAASLLPGSPEAPPRYPVYLPLIHKR